jgi:hypothetical protein
MTEPEAPQRSAVIWSPEGRADLRAIDRETAMQILHCVDRYLANRTGDVKKLKPPRTGFVSAVATTAYSSIRAARRLSPSPPFATVAKPTAEHDPDRYRTCAGQTPDAHRTRRVSRRGFSLLPEAARDGVSSQPPCP